jgi:hypothetical protein
MSEMQKEFVRIEEEKFALLSFSCGWRQTPKIKGVSFCLATTEVCGKSEDCAIWQFIKGLGLI